MGHDELLVGRAIAGGRDDLAALDAFVTVSGDRCAAPQMLQLDSERG